MRDSAQALVACTGDLQGPTNSHNCDSDDLLKGVQ